MKVANYILRGCAAFLICVAFITLMIPSVATTKTEIYASGGYYGGFDLGSSFSHDNYNFFDRMDVVSNAGLGGGLEVGIIILFVLSLVVIGLSFGVKFFKNFYLSIVPLGLFVLWIIHTLDAGTGYVLSSKYIGSIYGYSCYEESVITFNPMVYPALVLIFLGFACHLVAGILHGVSKRKAKKAAVEQPVYNYYQNQM